VILRDQSFGTIEYLPNVLDVGTDDRDADDRARMQVVCADLRRGGLGSTAEVRDERSQNAALLLQRVHIAEQQVELDPTDPHVRQSA